MNAGAFRRTPVRLVLVLIVVGLLFGVGYVLRPGVPERFDSIEDHFRYGSIGAEAGSGIPYWVWRVLPDLFPEYLPQNRPGEGYERFGFLYEEGADLQVERPIGTSYVDAAIPMLGVNCATCHTGSLREEHGGEQRLVLGMPAHQLDFFAYQQFLMDVAGDERFNGDVVISAIREVNPDFSAFDALLYRTVVIPRMRTAILDLKTDFEFLFEQTSWGPGRVDTFSPYKVRFGYDVEVSDPVGIADFPSLWNQAPREGMDLHWDGNNSSVEERNISASIGTGASEDSPDFASLGRIGTWIANFEPPPFPEDRIDPVLAERGRPIWEAQCASCHAFDGEQVGRVVDVELLGTDPERANSFDAQLAAALNMIGEGRPWQFSNFRDTNGYANSPLDGIWLRAPYLHNGSVPTLRDLLRPPDERPEVFYRGYDVYDFENLGFVSSGSEAEAQGVRLDTADRGNGNGGHLYGTTLSASEVDALLEFLKTQ
jgi:processive rubber oxygenase RoxA-like protein